MWTIKISVQITEEQPNLPAVLTTELNQDHYLAEVHFASSI